MLLAAAGAVLLLLGASAWAARPQVWLAGPGVVLDGLVALLGTSCAVLVGPVAFGVAYLTARRSSTVLEVLGLGWSRSWSLAWPVWLAMLLLSVLVSFVLEPIAWQQLRGVKEAALSSTVGWRQLQQGQVHVLSDGGAAVLREGTVHFSLGDRSWAGSAQPVRPVGLHPDWKLRKVELEERRQDGPARWEIEALVLRPAAVRPSVEPERPGSPLLAPLSRLRVRASQEPRAATVLWRKASHPISVLLLSLLGWRLAWLPFRAVDRRRRAGLLGVLLLVFFLVGCQVCDRFVGGILGGLAPLLIPLLGLFWGRR